MYIDFAKENWNLDELTYAYSYRFEEHRVFTQLSDCVVNQKDESVPGEFENIPLLTKKQYGAQTRVTTRCAFDGMGAPLILLADKMYRDADGFLRFGNYFEIVLYERGINVWRMWMRDGKVTWKKLMGAQFDVAEGEIHTLTAEIGTDTLAVEADGKRIQLYVPDLYTSYHVGITACEGINRFYDLELDGESVELM